MTSPSRRPGPACEAQTATIAVSAQALGMPASMAAYTIDTSHSPGYGVGYICEQAGTGTRFTLEAHVKPAGWYRLLGPIVGMIGRRQNRSDVRKLKAILESRH